MRRLATSFTSVLPLGLLYLASPIAHAWQNRDAPLNADPADVPWSYSGPRGPDHWGSLKAAFQTCETGRLQSPIRIEPASVKAETCDPLRFRYRSSSLSIINEANGLRLGYDRGSYLVIAGLSYELAELRFHMPAEHAIAGLETDGELQLIHGNNRGDIAIVAVPLRASDTRFNSILQRILDNAPPEGTRAVHNQQIGINALLLLPPRRPYFAYNGSLTRPPCKEIVHWYVLREPLEIGAQQLERMAPLTANNHRPIQPTNNRPVLSFCHP